MGERRIFGRVVRTPPVAGYRRITASFRSSRSLGCRGRCFTGSLALMLRRLGKSGIGRLGTLPPRSPRRGLPPDAGISRRLLYNRPSLIARFSIPQGQLLSVGEAFPCVGQLSGIRIIDSVIDLSSEGKIRKVVVEAIRQCFISAIWWPQGRARG